MYNNKYNKCRIRKTTGGSDVAIERMRKTSSGNVGIGTTDPKKLLYVRGKTMIESGLTANFYSS
jgi:hypothetical protein